MFLRWPAGSDKVPQNCVDSRLVGNIDLAPSALMAARGGAGPPPGYVLDGRPLQTPTCDPIWTRYRILLERPYRPSNQDVDAGQPPLWASTRTDAYQYTEYYDMQCGTAADPDVCGDERSDGKPNYSGVTFQEYYDLIGDPLSRAQHVRRSSPPPVALAQANLANDRICVGQPGQVPGPSPPPPCP